MKIEINLSAEEIKKLSHLISEWEKFSPFPLTHFANLKILERALGSELTFALLRDENINKLKIQLKNERDR